MSYNGSGVYTLPGAQLANGEVVSATENNQFRNDVAAALNVAWTRDGQAPAASNIPMNNYKFTGLGAGSNAGDSVRFEQFASPPAIGGTAPAAGTFTILKAASYRDTKAAISASNIDLNAGNYFSKTITDDITFTVSNVPTTGTVASFILDLTDGGSETVTWWSGIEWNRGVAPVLTSVGRDVLGFFTEDGGTTWVGLVLAQDLS